LGQAAIADASLFLHCSENCGYPNYAGFADAPTPPTFCGSFGCLHIALAADDQTPGGADEFRSYVFFACSPDTEQNVVTVVSFQGEGAGLFANNVAASPLSLGATC
jgi:hypothetical protein